MIYVGIDDTDVQGSVGTKQLARVLAAQLADRYRCRLILRHQLLQDPRVPCTTKNSSVSLQLEPLNGSSHESLFGEIREFLRAHWVEGSDPGLCLTESVPEEVTSFARRCQRELVAQGEARRLAEQHGIPLEGLGGTEDGVIGALAAVGLAVDGSDGRVLQIGQWPDDLAGMQEVETLRGRGVEVRCLDSGAEVTEGTVDVGKHLRPNYRQERVVLFVQSAAAEGGSAPWQAVRLL